MSDTLRKALELALYHGDDYFAWRDEAIAALASSSHADQPIQAVNANADGQEQSQCGVGLMRARIIEDGGIVGYFAGQPQAQPSDELERLRFSLALLPEDEVSFPMEYDVAVIRTERYWQLREIEEKAQPSAQPAEKE